MIDEKKIESVSGGVPDEAYAEIEAWQNGQSETKSMDTFEFVDNTLIRRFVEAGLFSRHGQMYNLIMENLSDS